MKKMVKNIDETIAYFTSVSSSDDFSNGTFSKEELSIVMVDDGPAVVALIFNRSRLILTDDWDTFEFSISSSIWMLDTVGPID